MAVLRDCTANLENIFSASLLASKHEITPGVNESAFIHVSIVCFLLAKTGNLGVG